MTRHVIPLKEISAIVGERHVLTAPEDLHCYGYDASKIEASPQAAVFPGCVDEVSALLRLANRYRIPVFPRGAGTGMVGAAVPWGGGMVVVLTRLNRIIEIDPDNMLAVVEPGVVTGNFQQAVARLGLLYPPDPASLQFCTLGGNVAMCAGGPRAVKYGVTRDYVLGLEVVLPTGTVIRTGTRTVKGVVGYDLTRLMVGSEGTLGIFTKIILRLVPAPESVRTLLAVFPRLEAAAETVSSITRRKIVPSTMELLDRATIRVVERYLQMGLPTEAEAILLIEVDGPVEGLDANIDEIGRICLECGASQAEIARSGEEREKLWRARRAVSPALGQIKPGKINEDVTVPRTQIPALIRAIEQLADRYSLTIVCFGHAGDGNIHTNVMIDRKDQDEVGRARKAVEELFGIVLKLGGTLSGEHGVGISKSPFLEKELGSETMQVMWKIKQALDPLNILNPGKMFVPNWAFFEGSKRP